MYIYLYIYPCTYTKTGREWGQALQKTQFAIEKDSVECEETKKITYSGKCIVCGYYMAKDNERIPMKIYKASVRPATGRICGKVILEKHFLMRGHHCRENPTPDVLAHNKIAYYLLYVIICLHK